MSNSPLESKSAFARRLGLNKSTITRWHKSGRLVVNVAGKVLINESLARIKATEGARSDLKEKHAVTRGNEIKTATAHENGANNSQEQSAIASISSETADKNGIEGARAAYKAIAVDMDNKLQKLGVSLNKGVRLDKQDACESFQKLAINLKKEIENMIDNLAPQIVTLSPSEKVARIKTEIEKIKNGV